LNFNVDPCGQDVIIKRSHADKIRQEQKRQNSTAAKTENVFTISFSKPVEPDGLIPAADENLNFTVCQQKIFLDL
jgi:hypothetical protein